MAKPCRSAGRLNEPQGYLDQIASRLVGICRWTASRLDEQRAQRPSPGSTAHNCLTSPEGSMPHRIPDPATLDQAVSQSAAPSSGNGPALATGAGIRFISKFRVIEQFVLAPSASSVLVITDVPSILSSVSIPK